MNPKLRKRGQANLRIRQILSIAIFCLACPATFFAQTSGAGATWQVEKYDLSVQLPSGETDRSLTVKAKLDLKNVSGTPASTLTLRISPSATVSSVSVNGGNSEFTKGQDTVAGSALQRLGVRMPAVGTNGSMSVVVDYKLAVKDNSGLAALSPVGSQFLPLSFWYPTPNSWYFARGADYAPTRIQINGAGTVVSSGVESAGAYDQKYFVQPFFLTGNWQKVSSTGAEVFIPAAAEADAKLRASEIASLSNEARSFLATQLGKAPDMPIRIVGVKRGGGFASGGTILIDEAVFRRSKIDSGTAMNISEAVAKMFVADSHRITGEGLGIIREGLVRYLATQFLESKYGKGVADVERLRQRISYSLVSQRDGPLTQIAPVDDFYYSAAANKGAMVWRVLSKRIGADEFNKRITAALSDGNVTLAKLRNSFQDQNEFLDAMFTKVTDTNLLVGLPQPGVGETKAALRNTGSTDVSVNVTATMANGEKMVAPVTIRATSFGEVSFKTSNNVVRLEIDSEKLYPQTNYSDDVAPKESDESDLQLAVKRGFDKQDYSAAENSAKVALRGFPNYDDVRILYARTLLALNRNADAEREFKAALDETLPSARTLAWGNLGLAETASRLGKTAEAIKFAENAIRADAEYGATLAARRLRSKLSPSPNAPEDIKTFFATFDRATLSGRKTDVEALVFPGEVTRFVGGLAGQTVEWKTTPTKVDMLDPNQALVETDMSVRLLNRQTETGMAVYRLIRSGSGWKIYNVDIFEVR